MIIFGFFACGPGFLGSRRRSPSSQRVFPADFSGVRIHCELVSSSAEFLRIQLRFVGDSPLSPILHLADPVLLTCSLMLSIAAKEHQDRFSVEIAPRGNHLNGKKRRHSRKGHKKAQERTKTPTDRIQTYGIRLLVFLCVSCGYLLPSAQLGRIGESTPDGGGSWRRAGLLWAGLPTRPPFDRRSPVYESECAARSTVYWRPTVGAAVRSGDRTTTVRRRGLDEGDGQAVGARIHVGVTRPASEDRALKPEYVAVDKTSFVCLHWRR